MELAAAVVVLSWYMPGAMSAVRLSIFGMVQRKEERHVRGLGVRAAVCAVKPVIIGCNNWLQHVQ